MTAFRYRAMRPDGVAATGVVEAGSRAGAIAGVRRLGAVPIEVVAELVVASGPVKASAKVRAGTAAMVGELAVLLNAGLQLDRALALAIDNVEDRQLASTLVEMLRAVREGASLSGAMAQRGGLFSATAIAMAEAGEANGRLGHALERLAAMLEKEADLRRLVTTSMIYPIALLVVAVGVIGLMLLLVVPQFEALFATSQARLPTASLVVMAASRALRDYWHFMLLVGIGVSFAIRHALAVASTRQVIDRLVLDLPQLGALVQRIETARFARTLGVLIEGNVPLPTALTLAQRTIHNRVMSRAVGLVATGVREGSGLTAPLAAANILPRMAIGFFRTGEESSQLGLMLGRLADVLDRDVKMRLQRLIGIATPVITVLLGVTVAAIIASIMSAILGFNDLAIVS